jgi:pimeloyl-ACP methyl ester carboxylesterase
MPAVFVHGNPETDAIWGPLLTELGRSDAVCLSPPGFGAPIPDGWGASREDYVDWLTAELERIEAPVDLVGHDWGGGHVVGVATTRPDLIRSWCSDVLGLFHPDYVWHDLAQAWMTPGTGEAAIEQMMSAPVEDAVALFGSFGVGEDIARALAEAADAQMGRCILGLYRSAPESVLRTVDLEAAAERPGLAIVASDDPYVGTEAMIREAASRAGAGVAVLEGAGHWWMTQDPAAAAAVLTSFWERLGPGV